MMGVGAKRALGLYRSCAPRQRIYLEYERWRVNCPGCGGLHVEHLDWLANNSRYT